MAGLVTPGVEYYYQINKAGKRFMAEDGRRDTMTKHY